MFKQKFGKKVFVLLEYMNVIKLCSHYKSLFIFYLQQKFEFSMQQKKLI